MTHTGIEPVLPPWKGDVLTAWPMGLFILSYLNSPSRVRTYDPPVNSRMLCRWAIEEYFSWTFLAQVLFKYIMVIDLCQYFFYTFKTKHNHYLTFLIFKLIKFYFLSFTL